MSLVPIHSAGTGPQHGPPSASCYTKGNKETPSIVTMTHPQISSPLKDYRPASLILRWTVRSSQQGLSWEDGKRSSYLEGVQEERGGGENAKRSQRPNIQAPRHLLGPGSGSLSLPSGSSQSSWVNPQGNR